MVRGSALQIVFRASALVEFLTIGDDLDMSGDFSMNPSAIAALVPVNQVPCFAPSIDQPGYV